MVDGYIVENGVIKVTLTDADLEVVLDEIKECRHLLEPEIKLDGNTVIFREQDIKLLDPKVFFKKKIPAFSLDRKQTLLTVVLCALWPLYFALLSIDKPLLLILFNSFIGISMSFIIYGVAFNYLRVNHEKQYRKAVYVKATLITFFYVMIMDEQTIALERVERTANRYNNDLKEIKHMYKHLAKSLPHHMRLDMPDRFPDGEEICPEVKNFS